MKNLRIYRACKKTVAGGCYFTINNEFILETI